MLTDKDLGIQKFILDRIAQIDNEIVQNDPEYKERGERPGELLKLVAAKLSPEDGALLKEYVNTCFDQICRSRRANLQRGADGRNVDWILGGLGWTRSR